MKLMQFNRGQSRLIFEEKDPVIAKERFDDFVDFSKSFADKTTVLTCRAIRVHMNHSHSDYKLLETF